MSMCEPSLDFNLNKEGIDWERVAQKVLLVLPSPAKPLS